MTPQARDRIALVGLAAAPAAILAVTLGLAVAVLADGLPRLSPAFLAGMPAAAGREGGILPMIVATAWVLGLALLVAAPVGLLAGAWLAEYTRSRTVQRALDVLSSVPSIVFGLFGMAFFSEACGLGWSVLSGALSVAMMILPLFVRLTEVGLRAVPDAYRAAGMALALPRWRLLLRVLLPQATPALVAALVLATGRVLAESAVFLFTAGATLRTPEGPLDAGRTLALHVYLMAVEVPGGAPSAAATACVLLATTLATTLAAHLAPRILQT